MTVILKLNSWKQRKYLQFIFLNMSSTFSGFAFFYLIFHRFIIEIEQMTCMISMHLMLLGIGCNYVALISLSVDCVVAVYWPLKFKVIMTTKKFFIFNSASVILMFVTLMLPAFYFGNLHDGILQSICEIAFAAPRYYIYFIAAFHVVVFFVFIVLNVGIAIGILISVIRRRKVITQENESISKILRSTIRLAVIITVNFMLNMPSLSNLIFISHLPQSVVILLSVSSGPLNVIIFIVSDREFRDSIRKVLLCI